MVTINIDDDRRSQTAQSAERVASNDDLLTEILLRLPIRSLLRVKSVSKHWRSVITSPYFSFLRNLNPAPPSGLFLQISSYPIALYEYISFDNENLSNPPFRILRSSRDQVGVSILQSCNGLLFCCSSEWREPNQNYHIYNPTTKQFTTLPPLSGSAPPRISCMILAFDPSSSPHYKVICVLGAELEYTWRIEIYSSQTRSWRVCGQPFEARNTYFRGGVYWNGAIHWTSGSENSLCFKIDEERLETIAMPPLTDRWDEPCGPSYFGESHGHLHRVQIYGPRATQLNVYEMERDYCRWYLKYQVDLEFDELPSVYPEMVRRSLDPMDRNYFVFAILSLVRGEREEDSFIVFELPSKAIKYNTVDKTSKMLHDFAPYLIEDEIADEVYLKFGSGASFQYIESLSCV